jgi:hypothetical protein
MTTAGPTHARRGLVEVAWADRSPAKGSRPVPRRLAKQPKGIQASSGQAPVRLGQRDRGLGARGPHAPVVTGAMAREGPGLLGAMAKEGPLVA